MKKTESLDKHLPTSTQLTSIYRDALEINPDKLAVIIGDTSCSYRKLEIMVDLYSRALSSIGVKKDSVVCLFMPNCLEVIWLFMACIRLGAIANMTSIFSQVEEVVYEINSSQSSFMLLHSTLYPIVENIKSQAPSLQRIFIVNAPHDHSLAWSRVVRLAPSCLKVSESLSEDQIAAIFYTSGSTAKPKGVTHTHKSFFHGAYNRTASFSHQSQHVFASTAQLSHFLAYVILLSMLKCGGTSVFSVSNTEIQKYNPGEFINLLQAHKVTHIHAVPTHWRKILEYPLLEKSNFASVEYAYAGADNVSSELQQEFNKKLGIPLSVTYGMTECGMISKASGTPLPNEIGKPLHATSLRLVDEHDQDVPLGEVGQIIVKSHSLMVGYWNDPENTGMLLKNGWFYTGDLARQDDNGRYFFVGRCKNTIIHCGGNISPEEVEDAIRKHPAVKNCLVVGIADKHGSQTVAAFIIPANSQLSPTPQELITCLTPLISTRKIPELWYFTDKFPTNSNGKVDRKQLAYSLNPPYSAKEC